MSDKPHRADTSGIVTHSQSGNIEQNAKRMRRDMTPSEELLWSHLRRNGLGGFHVRRQQIIDGFIVDFYCHAAATIIELDGPIHQFQRGMDAAREERLRARGLDVLRFTNSEVMEGIDEVLGTILRIFQSRTQPPNPLP